MVRSAKKRMYFALLKVLKLMYPSEYTNQVNVICALCWVIFLFCWAILAINSTRVFQNLA